MAVFDNRFVNFLLKKDNQVPLGRRPTTLLKACTAAVLLAFPGGAHSLPQGDCALFWLYWALVLYSL